VQKAISDNLAFPEYVAEDLLHRNHQFVGVAVIPANVEHPEEATFLATSEWTCSTELNPIKLSVAFVRFHSREFAPPLGAGSSMFSHENH
jgi:hypothetical protein